MIDSWYCKRQCSLLWWTVPSAKHELHDIISLRFQIRKVAQVHKLLYIQLKNASSKPWDLGEMIAVDEETMDDQY